VTTSQNDTGSVFITCARCGNLSAMGTLTATDGEYEGKPLCFLCVLELSGGPRRTGWPPTYETKLVTPMECKGGDCDCQRKGE